MSGGLVIGAAFVALVAARTYYDAVGFPRLAPWMNEQQKDRRKNEQRAFHRRLYALDALFGLAFAGVCVAASDTLAAALYPVAGAAVFYAFATVDILYWVWRLALGLSTYADWRPLSPRPYRKKTNIPWLLIATLLRRHTLPKYVDTALRIAGLVLTLYLFTR